MAKKTREEWLAGLKVGDVISCTFPGDESPSVGRVERLMPDHPAHGANGVQGSFPGRPWETFWNGRHAGHGALLQMVATGSGGSVGLPISVSNLQARADGKDADDAG